MIDRLSERQLDAYFSRIGFAAAPRTDLETLRALHTAHQAAIPFENLDVQLGRPPGFDPDAAFAKLVEARRGGWCYEQNGLFGRALAALGFEVTRVAGAVMRQARGETSLGSHLALLVPVEEGTVLADVGFGASVGAPVLLEAGRHDDGPAPVELEHLDDGYWRLHVDQATRPMSYDFRAEPADEALLARMCAWQGNAPESVFVQTLTAQRRLGIEHRVLRGLSYERSMPEGREARLVGSAEDLVGLLRDAFTLDVPEVAGVWDRIRARHEAQAADQPSPALPTT